jgi:hypothetical protein
MKKAFDAVNFQRKIRAELSKQYLENREGFLKEIQVGIDCTGDTGAKR